MTVRRQTKDTLWTLIVPPAAWAAHFLVSYVTAAVSCARTTFPFASIEGPRWLIAGATAIALGLILAVGRRAWREWRHSEGELPHDAPTAGDRERLLEFATVLLAGLSAVGVLFVALPAPAPRSAWRPLPPRRLLVRAPTAAPSNLI